MTPQGPWPIYLTETDIRILIAALKMGPFTIQDDTTPRAVMAESALVSALRMRLLDLGIAPSKEEEK